MSCFIDGILVVLVSNKDCRPVAGMHSFVIMVVTFSAVGRQECRPSLSCFIDGIFVMFVSNKEGRHSCRPAAAMHSFAIMEVTIAGVRRDESRLYTDFVFCWLWATGVSPLLELFYWWRICCAC